MEKKPISEWPFSERRHPTREHSDYLGFLGLSVMIPKVTREDLGTNDKYDILDIGCVHKSFYPFFAAHAKSYVGNDIIKDSDMIDIVCPAEALDVEDESVDLILCFSVLEHVDDPAQSVREMFRVLCLGGVFWRRPMDFSLGIHILRIIVAGRRPPPASI